MACGSILDSTELGSLIAEKRGSYGDGSSRVHFIKEIFGVLTDEDISVFESHGLI